MISVYFFIYDFTAVLERIEDFAKGEGNIYPLSINKIRSTPKISFVKWIRYNLFVFGLGIIINK